MLKKQQLTGKQAVLGKAPLSPRVSTKQSYKQSAKLLVSRLTAFLSIRESTKLT